MTETATEVPAPPLDKLAEALAAFQAEMPVVAKSHTATVKSDKGSYSYTYAGLANVSAAAMPLLAKHGLSFSCLPGSGVLTGMLLHSSGQSLAASLPINGSTPQQVGSSLTYMRRYLLGCLTGIVTDDDDDGSLAQSAAKRPAAKKAAAQPPPLQDGPPGEPAPPKWGSHAPMQPKTRGRMFALFGELKIDDEDEQRRGISHVIGREVTSRADLTDAEAKQVIAVLEARKNTAVKA